MKKKSITKKIEPQTQTSKVDMRALKKRWRNKVYENANNVDPHDDADWRDLLLGFLLGAGVSVKSARTIYYHAPSDSWPI